MPAALRALHRPEADVDVEQYEAFASSAHERLVLEELYLLELGLAMRRARAVQRPGIAIDASRPESREAAKALPFRLTGAQRRVMSEILEDLGRPHPMNRLVQGDVGSGKTAIALLSAVAVAACGGQTALMAPTELLAEQHFRTLSAMAGRAEGGMGRRIGLLTASLPRAEIKAVRGLLAMGSSISSWGPMHSSRARSSFGTSCSRSWTSSIASGSCSVQRSRLRGPTVASRIGW